MPCVCANIVVPVPVPGTPSAQQSVLQKIDKNPVTLDRLLRNWQYFWQRGPAAFVDLTDNSGLELTGGGLRIAAGIGLARSAGGLSVAMRPNRTGGVNYDPATGAILVNGLQLVGTGMGQDPVVVPQAGDARWNINAQQASLAAGPWVGDGRTDATMPVALGGALATLHAAQPAIVNTAATGNLGSFPLKANILVPGKILRVRAFGTYQTAGPVALALGLAVGSVYAMTVALTTPNTAGVATPWSLELQVAVRSGGANTSGTANISTGTFPICASSTPDFTIATTVAATARWTAAAADSTIHLEQLLAELLN